MKPPSGTAVRDAFAAGLRFVAEHGIDLDSAQLAFKSMHPEVDPTQVELATILELAMIAHTTPPFTVESIAAKMANTSGAFPWDGPAGNGMTLDEYRDRFRGFARQRLFFIQQLRLTTEQAGRDE